MQKRRVRDTVLLSGWLFADLLLALAVIFLANTAGIQLKPVPTPTPTATPTPTVTPTPTPSPTPVPLPRLELQYHKIFLTINDPQNFPSSSAEDDSIRSQMREQGILQGRRVGLLVIYGGAPTTNDIGRAQQIALKIKSILQTMSNFSLYQASYYDPLYTLGGDTHTARIDIYLFAQ